MGDKPIHILQRWHRGLMNNTDEQSCHAQLPVPASSKELIAIHLLARLWSRSSCILGQGSALEKLGSPFKSCLGLNTDLLKKSCMILLLRRLLLLFAINNNSNNIHWVLPTGPPTIRSPCVKNCTSGGWQLVPDIKRSQSK